MPPEEVNPKNRVSDEEGLPHLPVRGPCDSYLTHKSKPTADAERVSPEMLRGALRRRGLMAMGGLGLTLGASLALPAPLNSVLCIVVLGCVFFQPRPLVVFQSWFRQRCPACDTPLESLPRETEADSAAETCLTRCPACEVEV